MSCNTQFSLLALSLVTLASITLASDKVRAEIIEPSRGEATATQCFDELGLAIVSIDDEAAKQMFENMVDIKEDEQGVKNGKSIRCSRTRSGVYGCDFYMDSFGRTPRFKGGIVKPCPKK